MFEVSSDQLEIRNLIESWAIWRDSGDWDRLRTCWHQGGMMQTTWFHGTGDEFVAGSQAAFNRGVEVLHTLSGTSVDVEGDRAIAQTKMAIHQRAVVNGAACDCVCMGRFYDFLEKRDGRWGIMLRQPIYEMDRLDPARLLRRSWPGRGETGIASRGLPSPGLRTTDDRIEGYP